MTRVLRHDPCAHLGGGASVERYQPGIVDPAIGIFVGPREALLQGQPGCVAGQIDRARRRQDLAAADRVVEQQAEPDQPGGPLAFQPGHEAGEQPAGRRVAFEAHVARIGQDEPQRPADVRHGDEERLALFQRLADKTKLEIFEVAQAAVEQFGGGGRRRLRHIALFGQGDGQPPSGGVPRNSATVDSAADDEQVDRRDLACDAQEAPSIGPVVLQGF